MTLKPGAGPAQQSTACRLPDPRGAGAPGQLALQDRQVWQLAQMQQPMQTWPGADMAGSMGAGARGGGRAAPAEPTRSVPLWRRQEQVLPACPDPS